MCVLERCECLSVFHQLSLGSECLVCATVCVFFYLKVVDSLSFIVVVSVIFGILAAQRSINQSFPSASYSHRLVDINAALVYSLCLYHTTLKQTHVY